MAFTDKDREKLTQVHTLMMDKLIPLTDDHEDRIRKIEKSQFKAMGANSVLSAFFGGLMGWFGGHGG